MILAEQLKVFLVLCSTLELNFQFSDSGQDCAEDAFGSSASSEDIDIDMNSLDSGTE